MATLILGAAGAAIGGSIGGAILGVSAATIGGFIGSTIGSVVDSWIISSLAPTQRIEGARLDTLRITSATEGAVIPRLYGRMRMGGNIIWATDFREETKTTTQGGGKGGGGGKVKTTEYLYYASFAVALCEGPITGIGRIWADGKPMDLSGVTWRWYPGDEAQTADPFIAAKMGAASTPAYRGTAYVVFEELALSTYGNRLPQLSFEVFRPLADPDTAEGLTRAVTMIPASGEFTYATQAIRKTDGGATQAENLNALADSTDMVVALDRLQAMAPAVESVSLVVAWFGDDLRAGSCKVRPGVEVSAKSTTPASWSVNGVSRAKRLPRQPRRSGPPRLWRHAVRLRGGAGDPGDEGARAARHLLSVHPDGRAARQQPAEPVFRQRRRDRPARIPLAGADHLFSGGGFRRDRGQDRHGRKPGRGAVRRGHARELQRLGSVGFVDRHARRLGPAAHGAALRPSLRGGGRGRCLPDRHRDAGADDDPLGRVHLSGGAGLSGSARGCALDPRVRHEDRLCGRLVGVFRAPAGRRQRRRVLPPRSALGRSGDRFRRDRQLHAALGLARRVRACRRGRGLARDLRPGLPAGEHRGRRRLRLVLCQRRRPIRAGPDPDHRWRRRQAMGLPLQGSARLVVEPALQPPGRGGERDADGMGAAVEADLVHRARLSGHRPGHQPAQRLLRPEVVRELHAAFLAGLARRRDPARLSRGDVSLVGRGREQPGVLGLWRPHGACARMRRLDLGRAALSVLSGADRRLDRRRRTGGSATG